MKTLKIILLFLTGLGFCYTAVAQQAGIKNIEVYGNRKIPTAVILSRLDQEVIQRIDPSTFVPTTISSAVSDISGVKHVNVDLICCDTANSYLVYIGIAENDAVISEYRAAPGEDIKLSPEVLASYNSFNQQVKAAVQQGENAEDYLNGYSLLKFPAARKEQMKFIEFANQKLPELQQVLINSKHSAHRAAAAQIIAYSENKNEMSQYLVYALQDSDENVRNNAARALGILAGYLAEHPEMDVRIPATPFIQMLNSISWTDRNKASMVLAQLTLNRDPQLLEQIRKEAMPSLIEMAEWKNREHALFSYMILGRIAGEDENELIKANFSENWADTVARIIRKCG